MKDILLNKENDLEVINGDFVTGDSSGQNQKLLLLTDKGEWKQNPTVGVGVEGFLLDEDVDGLFREIRAQFTSDGMKVKAMNVLESGKLNIDANY